MATFEVLPVFEFELAPDVKHSEFDTLVGSGQAGDRGEAGKVFKVSLHEALHPRLMDFAHAEGELVISISNMAQSVKEAVLSRG